MRHRDRKGLRRRQTLVRRSGFADRKTQPLPASAGGDGSAGRAASRSQGAPIGPPSQQVSRIAPHVRHTSLARISKVSPWQMGQRPVLMGARIQNGRPAARPRRRSRRACGSRAGPSAEGEPPTADGRACHDREPAILTPRRSRAAAGGWPRSRPSGRASRGGGPSTGPPRPSNATRRGLPWIGSRRKSVSGGRFVRPDTCCPAHGVAGESRG